MNRSTVQPSAVSALFRAVALEAIDVRVIGHAVDLDRNPSGRNRDVDDAQERATDPHRMVGDPAADTGTAQQAVEHAFGIGGRAVAQSRGELA
ncbi:MAG: hypothetical protein QOJ34_1352 [Pseudonocardiales bacterium]|nr:hypothetical protein [Pseudonocardiales bacterium]